MDWSGLVGFLTSATAPWWSGLLGIIVGATGAYLTAKKSDERRLKAEREALVDERAYQAEKEHKAELRKLVAEFIATATMLRHEVERRRRDYGQRFASDGFPASKNDHLRVIADHIAELTPQRHHLEALLQQILMLDSAEVADASGALAATLLEWPFDVSPSAYEDWRDRTIKKQAHLVFWAGRASSHQHKKEFTETTKSGPDGTASTG